ncbi:MAG: VOC family protein [Acidobacteria bacterium]|nr:VOC family protein [Acidobacteriota bacterium]
MIHVPDVRATVAWYESIGFAVLNSVVDGGEMSWALMSMGRSEVMFNAGGHPSTSHRREVDLYVHAENVAVLFESLKTRAEVVKGIHDTFYGTREFIVRDPNRFWVTFAEEASSVTS